MCLDYFNKNKKISFWLKNNIIKKGYFLYKFLFNFYIKLFLGLIKKFILIKVFPSN